MPFKTILLLPAFISLNVFSQIDYKGFPQWSRHQRDSTEYFLYTPSKMKKGKKYPIALFMHGCCGTDYHASLRNCVDPPVRMWHNFGANTQVIPTYIISPATSRGWQQHFKNLKAVIDDLIANHNGDPRRVYVCGFSMGGDGTVKILQQYPGFFAAAIPMGMGFSGDSTLLKDVPIWTAQGETDWWSRNLRKNVAGIRHLNGYAADTGGTWVTGVNPRYSNFKGVDHGVQWDAASTLPLTTWAYSKVNDGNKYPQVFFASPAYRQRATEGSTVSVDIRASDADGSIAKVEIFHNNQLYKTLTASPYTTTISPVAGDNIIDAVVYDNKGKTAMATTIVKVNVAPEFPMIKMLNPKAGAYFILPMHARGNGNIVYHLQGKLPAGLSFFEDGFIRGVPLTPGPGDFSVMAVDEDNDSTIKKFSLLVENKNPQTVIITNAVNKAGIPYEIAIMRNGETPNFSSNSTRKTTYTEEINFSNIGPFAGLPYIRTDINDTAATAADFLSFEIDEDAVIYVAYEKFDRQLHSTIPAWLKGWKKERGEIAAQYRYFNVYSKPFPRGKVILPGADAPRSGVVFNYFVMAKKTATAVAAQKTGPLKPDFSPPRNIPGMTLRWSDEFNIPGRPDSTKWTYENGFVRNNELQWYQRENASVKNGCLVIEGRREKLKNPRYDSSSQRWQLNREYAGYTASSLKTQGLQQFHYGRIEVRARVDTTLGSWPAIWTLGINQRWPLNGEVDVMEFYRVNNVPTILANTAYGRNQNGGPVWNTKRLELSHFIARDKDWPKKFHIWRMDWSEDSINLYLDDELLNTTLLKNTLNPDGFNPFQQPHYLLLNLAIGSNGGDPAHAKYPIKYEVDYVRYYQKQNR